MKTKKLVRHRILRPASMVLMGWTLTQASLLRAEVAASEDHAERPLVQLALLLDTSSSMSGLIDQAKTQLWQIVNEFITAKQQGETPVVQVALFEYGNNQLPSEAQWMRKVQPLTRDLDALSASLFALKASTVSGGNEYSGSAIALAAESLDWLRSPSHYKAIFIAGNESFLQGPVSPAEACRKALEKGVVVNTIFCGSEAQGIALGWKEGALRADGEFMHIDHNEVVAQIAAPQDRAIVTLNERLNDTYIAFGLEADRFRSNQLAQDANAASLAVSNLAERARSKASANYFNAQWDLVDAFQQTDFDWASVEKKHLPEPLRKMSDAALKVHVEAKKEERARLQAEILKMTQERDDYVASKRQELGERQTLGSAVRAVVRKQASTKGVEFDVMKEH